MSGNRKGEDDQPEPKERRDHFALPKVLGEYEIVLRIGGGGMGTVFKAVHRRLKRTVALKVIRLDKSFKRSAVDRFLREMEVVGKLDHDNIVAAYDAGQVDGTHYLAMEYIAGCDVGRLVQSQGPLPLHTACQITYEVSQALAHADHLGVVHRDLKPSNILLAETGCVKVADFGLARLVHTKTANLLTSGGQIVGTLDYIAPEQIEDTSRVDIRADIYSLGCTFYYMLTGSPPFGSEEYDSVLRKIKAHAEVVPTPIQQIRDDVPDEISRIVSRMLEKDPEHRFSGPQNLAEAIEPYGQGANLQHLVEEPTVGEEERFDTPHAADTARQQSSRRSPKVASGASQTVRYLLAAAVLVLVAVVAFIVIRDRGGHTPTAAESERGQAGESPPDTPPGDSDDSDSETALRPFEDLQPGDIEPERWYTLLNKPPTKLVWPPPHFGPRSVLDHDSDRRSVHLHAYETAYVAFGEVDRDSYVLQVDISRSTWEGGTVGVFLGYRENADGTEATCQTFEIQSGRSRGQWQLNLARTNTEITKDGTRAVDFDADSVTGVTVPNPGIQPATLEITVARGQVFRVKWDGNRTSDLCDTPSRQSGSPNSFHGKFGVFASSATADFENASIIVQNR